MANEITIINSVTKQRIGNTGEYHYEFPQAFIMINTADDSMVIRTQKNYARDISILFANLTENFGTSNIEEYADYLADNRYYFGLDTDAVGNMSGAVLSFTNQLISTSAVSVMFETSENLAGISIDVSRTEITFDNDGVVTAFLEMNMIKVGGSSTSYLEIWIQVSDGMGGWISAPTSGAFYQMQNLNLGSKAYIFQGVVAAGSTYRIRVAAPSGDVQLTTATGTTDPTVSVASAKIRFR